VGKKQDQTVGSAMLTATSSVGQVRFAVERSLDCTVQIFNSVNQASQLQPVQTEFNKPLRSLVVII
jgi:hypothetical protein